MKVDSLDSSLLNTWVLLITDVIKTVLMNIFLDSVEINVGNRISTIEDARNFFKSGPLGLRVDKVHPGKLDADPNLLNCQYM